MDYQGYKTLRFNAERGVMFVTINSPPINLMSLDMLADLNRFAEQVADDDEIRVIVFRSANPDYFIAHFDVTVLAEYPDDPPPRPESATGLGGAFRNMSKVSIAQIEGRARGGGSEFALSLDMRFGVLGKTILGQPEIAVGILPGGGGTQRLPRLIGRARALEVIMGGLDVTAEVAEQWGYLNRALSAAEIGPYVERLAYQIASYSAEAISLNKQSVNNADTMPPQEGFIEETWLFGRLAAMPDAKRRMHAVLAAGAQTYDGEMDFNRLIEALDPGA